MTDTAITPFEELEAMLLFASENRLTTIGEVEGHLNQARHSLMISRINNQMAEIALTALKDSIEGHIGKNAPELTLVQSVARHMDEMAAIEILATERDILVMENFLMFMNAAAGQNNSGEDIPF